MRKKTIQDHLSAKRKENSDGFLPLKNCPVLIDVHQPHALKAHNAEYPVGTFNISNDNCLTCQQRTFQDLQEVLKVIDSTHKPTVTMIFLHIHISEKMIRENNNNITNRTI